MAVRENSEKNDISFRGEEKMKCAYRFVNGPETMTIPLSKQNNAYLDFVKFFGIK